MPELVGVRRNLWMTRAPGGFRRMNFSIDGLVLYVPLWHPELKDSPFLSKDLNAHTLTVTGALWTSQGRSFDGNDFLKLNDGNAGSPLNFTTQDFTLIVWWNPSVLPTSDADSFTLVSRGVWLSAGWFIIFRPEAYRFLTAQAGAYQDNRGGPLSIALNTWYMAGIVRSNTSALFYHNGLAIPKSSVTDIINPDSSAQPTRIGILPDEASRPFKGIQGEVMVYNRVLSVSEIQHIHQTTKWRYV